MSKIDEDLEIIKRGCIEIISEAELRAKLEKSAKEKRPLRIKMGFDPTAPDLHLGHSLGIRKLKDFQDLGHEVCFIIGDFTAKIGDPTGKSKTRPPLTDEEIKKNSLTYQEQVFKILAPEKTKVLYNSEWCDKLNASDMIKLTAQMNVARMLEREDFKQRYTQGVSISIHEFLYPIMQAYDSIAIRADVEMGGQDQRFNLLVGRDFQKNASMPQQCAVMLPLLEGLDGVEKMSKSLGNAVGITESPEEMFGKIMSIPDTLLERYFELLTRVPKKEYQEAIRTQPRDAKMWLATEVIKDFHELKDAEYAKENFINRFSKKDYESVDADEIQIDGPPDEKVFEFLVRKKLLESKAEARRLIQQGGCRFIQNSEEVKLGLDASVSNLQKGGLLKVGKKKIFRLA